MNNAVSRVPRTLGAQKIADLTSELVLLEATEGWAPRMRATFAVVFTQF